MFDRKQSKKMLQTEKRLPSRHGSMWSPELKKTASILHYWQTILHAKLQNKQLHPDVTKKLEGKVSQWDKNQGNPE